MPNLMKATSSIRVLLLLSCVAGCGQAADPNARLEDTTQGYCELWMRCYELQGNQLPTAAFDDCLDGTMMILAVQHYIFGADCIDAFLDQVECRLDYDCDFPDEPACADGGAGCDSIRPCEELVPEVEQACSGLFVTDPDLGIGVEVQ